MSVFNKSKIQSLIIEWWPLLLLIPLSVWYFPININYGHDWGGDFAQYIKQAINIAEGKSLNTTSYIPNPDFTILGPSLYPNGFPVLLLPAYLIVGNSIHGFLTVVAIFYLLYTFISFFCLRRKFSNTNSLFITLLLLFNPAFVNYKAEIVSDVPFAVFFLGALYIITSKRSLNYTGIIIASLFAAYAVFIRSMGWCIPMGLGIYILIHFFKNGTLLKKHLFVLLLTVVFSILLLLILPSSSGSNYLDLYSNGSLWKSLMTNLETYGILLREFFPVYQPDMGIIQIILGSGLLVFSGIGFVRSFFMGHSVLSYIIAIYILSGLLYPANMYFRFFIPLIPILFLYAQIGVGAISFRSRAFFKYSALILIGVAVYFNSQHTFRVRSSGAIPTGPQQASSLEAFQFLEKHVGENEVVHFSKPRVLALYTGLQSFVLNPEQDTSSASKAFKKYNVKWILSSGDLKHEAQQHYIDKYKPEKVFENSGMRIYKIR